MNEKEFRMEELRVILEDTTDIIKGIEGYYSDDKFKEIKSNRLALRKELESLEKEIYQ